MISFNLKCDNDHRFESWFKSNAAFEKLLSAGMVQCVDCGSTQIEKTLMAPAVVAGRQKAAAPDLTSPKTDVEKAMTKMRTEVENNSDYVGMNFAAEARAINDGDSPQRSIYGEAKLDDAKALIDDGIPVAPLPFVPKRDTN